MYNNRTLGVKRDIHTNNINKINNSKRGNTRLSIEVPQHYRTMPGWSGSVKAEMIKNGEDIKSVKGRKSYSQKALEAGVYDDITKYLLWYSSNHVSFTDRQLVNSLKEEFPDIFAGEGCTVYPQNIVKALDRDYEWRNALGDRGITEKKNVILNRLYRRASAGVREEMDSTGKYYEVGMSDKDSINFIRLLNELELQQEQISKDANNSDKGVKFTFGDK